MLWKRASLEKRFRVPRTQIINCNLLQQVPALLSQFVTTIKDTSYLWGAMALQELMGRGMILMNSYNSTAQIFAIFGIMALIYFIVCFTLSQIVRAYQRRLKEARAA